MSTNYPAAVDDGTTLPNPGAGAPRNNPSLAGGQTNQNDAIKAIEAKVGTGASTPSAGLIFRGTGTGTSAWGAANLTTDITGTLPVANGGTGLTVLTIPASAILVGTTDAQDVTNKTLHDTFMGETFMSQSATFRNVVLDAAIDYLVTQLVEVGAAFSLEVPATSTLEITPFLATQSFARAQHDHTSAAGGGALPAGAILNASVTPDKLATGATNVTVATSETTASTSYTALATAQAVTVTIGANGIALVIVSSGGMGNTVTNGENFASFAMSGANILASSDVNAWSSVNPATADRRRGSTVTLLTGLTPGSTTFTAQFRVNAGTGTFVNRQLGVIPL